MKRLFKRLILLVFLFLTNTNVFAQDIFDCARKGDTLQATKLLKINPDTLNAINYSGFTPLILAAYRNQLDFVRFLLYHHVAVNTLSPEGTALLGVCYKGNIEIAKILINHKADVNIGNAMGTSPLMFAVMSNNLALAKLLLLSGAKKELLDKTGNTALKYAQMNEAEEMIKLLSQE